LLTAAYASDRPEPAQKSVAGSYVMLQLAYSNTTYARDLSKRPYQKKSAAAGEPAQGVDAPGSTSTAMA